jgi:serine/threonine-protein phosphatase 2A activator
MYNAEVLSKFPVVQHFHFGGLFKWERDPTAPATHLHLSHQPEEAAHGMTTNSLPPGGTNAPWAKQQTGPPIQTTLPRTTASGTLTPRLRELNIGPARESVAPATIPGPTIAPWSRQSRDGSGEKD